jgi:nucleoside-diphosphate-sugar epimerase
MKNFLVLGGAGYLGSEFCKYLLSKKKHVTCVDNFIYNNRPSIRNLEKKKNFKLINQDIRKFVGVKNFDAVIIFAGLVGDPITKKYKKLSHSINVQGIKKIVN